MPRPQPKKPNLIALIIPPILVAAAVIVWVIKSHQDASPPPAPKVVAPAVADNGPPLSADTGDLATRIYNRGMKSIRGEGDVPKDVPKGIQLLSQADQLGNIDAACTLGKIYAKGQGIAKDDTKALHWFARAAKKGNAEGMTALASAYETGAGTAPDPAAAKSWREKAAAANPPAK